MWAQLFILRYLIDAYFLCNQLKCGSSDLFTVFLSSVFNRLIPCFGDQTLTIC